MQRLTVKRAFMMQKSPNKKAGAFSRMNKKTRRLLAISIAAILLVSAFAVLFEQDSNFRQLLGVKPAPPKPGPGVIAAGQPVTSAVWLGVAADAWAYFQPGVGVDANTGLPYADSPYFKAFTAWDLGVYIQAVIDAQELGLVGTEGAWGSSQRLQHVMSFLQRHPLNESSGCPYWYYDAQTGQEDKSLSEQAPSPVDVPDAGRLLIALDSLRNYNSTLAPAIDSFVYNQTSYAALVPQIAEDADTYNIYGAYYDAGFASFWPQLSNVPTSIIQTIAEDPNTTEAYGITLPDTALIPEPLLCAIFELNSTSPELAGLMNQLYLAHEAYYNATGSYAAFSEGNSLTAQYIYEWVVAPNGGTWTITGTQTSQILNINPILYTKVGFSFLALYNSTFAQNLVVHIQNLLPDPAKGYSDGADTSGNRVSGTGSGTNGLILDAAAYAIKN